MRPAAPASALVLAVLLPLTLAAPALAASMPEGVVAPLAESVSVAWNVTGGTYWLAVVAGPEGAVLDASRISGSQGGRLPDGCAVPPQATPHQTPEPICSDPARKPMEPTSAFGHRLEMRAEDPPPRLAVVEGEVRTILARPDLHQPDFQNGSYARIGTRGDLAPGACVAQHVFESAFGSGRLGEVVLTGDVHVAAAGPGLRFAFLDARLTPVAEAPDVLAWRGDLRLDGAPAFVQACAPEDAPGNLSYVVRVERWAASKEAAARVGVPGPGAWPALAALGVAAATLVRRRGRGP